MEEGAGGQERERVGQKGGKGACQAQGVCHDNVPCNLHSAVAPGGRVLGPSNRAGDGQVERGEGEGSRGPRGRGG